MNYSITFVHFGHTLIETPVLLNYGTETGKTATSCSALRAYLQGVTGIAVCIDLFTQEA